MPFLLPTQQHQSTIILIIWININFTLISRFQVTLFLKHSIFHKKEGLEHGSFFKDWLRMWRHWPRRDAANICMMTSTGYKEYWSILATVEYLYTTADVKSFGLFQQDAQIQNKVITKYHMAKWYAFPLMVGGCRHSMRLHLKWRCAHTAT